MINRKWLLVVTLVLVFLMVSGCSSKTAGSPPTYSDPAKQECVSTEEVFVQEEDVPIWDLHDEIWVSGTIKAEWKNEAGASSGSVGSVPMMAFKVQNKWGFLVRQEVTADPKITMVSNSLEEGAQAFMRVIHTYAETTDANTDPPTVTRDYKMTNYHFYVPWNFYK